MPESNESRWDTVKNAVKASTVVVGATIGATIGAELVDMGFSEEKFKATEQEIILAEKSLEQAIGEENDCQLGIYNLLNDRNEFPNDRDEIAEVLTDYCETEPDLSEDKLRLIQSHDNDIARLEAERDAQIDKQTVSTPERILGGIFGGTLGLLAVGAYNDYQKFKNRNQDPLLQ